MKKRDLEKQLLKLGWWRLRHGGNHDYWTNGNIHEAVPRHREVGENLAKKNNTRDGHLSSLYTICAPHLQRFARSAICPSDMALLANLVAELA